MKDLFHMGGPLIYGDTHHFVFTDAGIFSDQHDIHY